VTGAALPPDELAARLDEIEAHEHSRIDGGEQGIAERDYQSRTILWLASVVRGQAEALQRVEAAHGRVTALHHRVRPLYPGMADYCNHCRAAWPCETAKRAALAAAAEPSGAHQ